MKGKHMDTTNHACDYDQADKLATILKDKRLHTKYGLRYGKHLRIRLGRQHYLAECGFIELMYKNYGDVSFKEGLKAWYKSRGDIARAEAL